MWTLLLIRISGMCCSVSLCAADIHNRRAKLILEHMGWYSHDKILGSHYSRRYGSSATFFFSNSHRPADRWPLSWRLGDNSSLYPLLGRKTREKITPGGHRPNSAVMTCVSSVLITDPCGIGCQIMLAFPRFFFKYCCLFIYIFFLSFFLLAICDVCFRIN